MSLRRSGPSFFSVDQRAKAWYFVKEIVGLDRAVSYSLLSKMWMLVATPITIWLITSKFSSEIQGYYYTFNSLLILQTFLELGFTIVLVQFISHEWAHLAFTEQMQIHGDGIALSRFASLVELAIKWYVVLSIVFFILVGVSGLVFLENAHTSVAFKNPWWLLCVAVSFNIILVPMRSFLEGSNRVHVSQQVYLKANIVAAIAGWIAIYLGAELYSAAVMSFSAAFAGFIYLAPKFAPYWNTLKHRRPQFRVSWKKDFWPQQWRIAISWISGFFMFQSFVPILFKLQGPTAAGQMGATLQVYNAVNSVAQSWTAAAAPQFGILGARKEIDALKNLVRKTYLRTLSASVILSCAAICLIALLHHFKLPQANRLADLYSVGVFLVVLIAMQLPNVETLAIRFQKKEPFLLNSIFGALLVVLSNMTLGKFYGTTGTIIGFAVVMLFVIIPWCHRIYLRSYEFIR